eukprot:TRINITY_DN7547_c0_g4_i1.p1 TRINITY_DN7547_c0_g4~~TRINITY_DN7547_c0_g4_i1.p1  ORF type:complete len:425 (-),score=95.79 TRINITY_DN7547_c0_g4_i1:345-1619(-)
MTSYQPSFYNIDGHYAMDCQASKLPLPPMWPMPVGSRVQPVFVCQAVPGFDVVSDPRLYSAPWPANWPASRDCRNGEDANAMRRTETIDKEQPRPPQEQAWLEPSYLGASASRRRRRQKAKVAHQQLEIDPATAATRASKEAERELSEAECAKVMKELESEDATSMAAAMDTLRGSVLDFAFDRTGCRVVQKALEIGTGNSGTTTAGQLAQELRGHVRRAIASPHGNYVIQKVVEQLPTNMSGFIVDELQGAGAQAARHVYGCRVLCRLIEHSNNNKKAVALIEEVLQQATSLCRDPYGQHVMEHILEHGLERQKSIIVQALLHDMYRNARDKQGSYVIEKALEHVTVMEAQLLEMALLAEPGNIIELAESQFGHHIVKTLLRQNSDSARIAQHIVRTAAERLRACKYGSRVLQELKSCSPQGQ